MWCLQHESKHRPKTSTVIIRGQKARSAHDIFCDTDNARYTHFCACFNTFSPQDPPAIALLHSPKIVTFWGDITISRMGVVTAVAMIDTIARFIAKNSIPQIDR